MKRLFELIGASLIGSVVWLVLLAIVALAESAPANGNHSLWLGFKHVVGGFSLATGTVAILTAMCGLGNWLLDNSGKLAAQWEHKLAEKREAKAVPPPDPLMQQAQREIEKLGLDA